MCSPAKELPETSLRMCNESTIIENTLSNLVTTPNSTVHSLPQIDQYRLQIYNYKLQAERVRLAHTFSPLSPAASMLLSPIPGPRWPFPGLPWMHPRISTEDPKPQHSYIGLIAMAILSSAEQKLVLSDIYQYILDNYPYFRTRGPGWRNSIRHNLSLNDCFVKSGRSANGKGHYWAIHPANVDDFKKGDFRRRKAQRRVRKHMGLAVDEDGFESPSPPPLSPPSIPSLWPVDPVSFETTVNPLKCGSRKRQFDMDSILAPDDSHPSATRSHRDVNGASSQKCNSRKGSEFISGMPLYNNPHMSIDPSSLLWCYPRVENLGIDQQFLHEHIASKYIENIQQAKIKVYQQLQLERVGDDSDGTNERHGKKDEIN